MFGARSPEEISREMEFVNNPAERETAKKIHAAQEDESKRSVSSSSSHALIEKEHKEKLLNEKAVAALIAADMEEIGDAKPSMSSTMFIKSVVLPIPARLNETKEELKDSIPGVDQLPHVLQNLCLDYEENPALLEEKIEKKIEKIVYPHTTFLKKTLAQKLHEAADDILLGYGDKALALVNQYPWVIECKTTGSDRFGRCIKERTLLQMAAMAGDVNLRDKKPEEKEDHGLVELLAQAGKLSQEEIANQLFSVLFSEEAKKENEARKNAVFKVLIDFAESILKRKSALRERCDTIEELQAEQAKCKPEIDKLRKDLIELVSNKTMTTGFILDSQVFVELLEWFEKPDNFNRFGSRHNTVSGLFWVNGYGSLQYVGAARDAEVCKTGIGYVAVDGRIPTRTMKNSEGFNHFTPASRLGLDFYLGGGGGLVVRFRDVACYYWKFCVEQKQERCKVYARPRLSSSKESVCSNVNCR